MKQKTKTGFTLIEILAVLSIIIVIMGLAVGLVAISNQRTTEARAHKEIAKIQERLDTLRHEKGSYEPDFPPNYHLPSAVTDSPIYGFRYC